MVLFRTARVVAVWMVTNRATMQKARTVERAEEAAGVVARGLG